MKVFCDTSLLVASALKTHPRHRESKFALDRVRAGEDIGFASAHTLAETFSVLSRMPAKPKLDPDSVLDILETDFIPHLTFISLPATDYAPAIRELAGRGLGGGRIYDLLHLRVAARLAPDRIYTLNEIEWRGLSPELAPLICAPPLPAA